MFYGLDFTDCKFVTDFQGNKLRADIPYPMFSALVEFWKEARRAHTAALEKRTPPGSLRSSFSNTTTTSDESETEAVPVRDLQKHPPHLPRDKWDELVSRMPIETKDPPDSESALPEQPPPIDAPESPAQKTAPKIAKAKRPSKWREPSFFPREFVTNIPSEICALINGGTHFLRAWREYRGFTLEDAAELYGKQIATIIWHERGLNVPNPATLAKFADIYDCSIEQLTPNHGTSTQAHVAAMPTKASKVRHEKISREKLAPVAPDDTDYPDVVLAHLIAGKSPLTAWRLYRGMTRAQLAQEYGASVSNITQLEAQLYLRPKTIDKLRVIVNCTAVQLLRPEGMKIEPHKLSARDAWQTSHVAA
jgi:transcriptional regulator with XRE-family HTH domain